MGEADIHRNRPGRARLPGSRAKVHASAGASGRSRDSGRPRTTVADLAAGVRPIGRLDLGVGVNGASATSCATASLFAARAGKIPGDPGTPAVTLAAGSRFLGP